MKNKNVLAAILLAALVGCKDNHTTNTSPDNTFPGGPDNGLDTDKESGSDDSAINGPSIDVDEENDRLPEGGQLPDGGELPTIPDHGFVPDWGTDKESGSDDSEIKDPSIDGDNEKPVKATELKGLADKFGSMEIPGNEAELFQVRSEIALALAGASKAIEATSLAKPLNDGSITHGVPFQNIDFDCKWAKRGRFEHDSYIQSGMYVAHYDIDAPVDEVITVAEGHSKHLNWPSRRNQGWTNLTVSVDAETDPKSLGDFNYFHVSLRNGEGSHDYYTYEVNADASISIREENIKPDYSGGVSAKAIFDPNTKIMSYYKTVWTTVDSGVESIETSYKVWIHDGQLILM